MNKRIFRAIIVLLFGAVICWQISLLFVSRDRMKEDEEEIMKFMEESEKKHNKSFDQLIIFP